MEVVSDAALDALLARDPGAGGGRPPQAAAEAVARWRREDPAGMALLLVAYITDSQRSVEVRERAAGLLRELLSPAGEEPPRGALVAPSDAEGVGWITPDLGRAVLEALAAVAHEPSVLRRVADAAAVVAWVRLSDGSDWPEFALLMSAWCFDGAGKSGAVLRIVEGLRDEAEARDLGDEFAGSMRCVYGLLTHLAEHNKALRELLITAFNYPEDGTSRDAAARIFVLCVAEPEVPQPVRAAVREVVPVLAGTALSTTMLEQRSGGDQTHCSEACLEAIALAAHAEPSVWAACAIDDGLGVESHAASSLASLPNALASIAAAAQAAVGVRVAALAALMELLNAVFATVKVDCRVAAGVEVLVVHAVATVAGLLAELPQDGATDAWAEAPCEDEGPERLCGGGNEQAREPDPESMEALLEAALDAAGRLAALEDDPVVAEFASSAVRGLRASASELLQREAWQARHGSLLLQLRLACSAQAQAADPGLCIEVAQCALQHCSHIHPRVRWAALEVLCRMMTMQLLEAHGALFEQMFVTVASLVAREHYERVTRRGLLALLLMVSDPAATLQAVCAAPLFREVLIPKAKSGSPDIRDACSRIAQAAAASLGLGASDSPEAMVPSAEVAELRGLWQEWTVVLQQPGAGEIEQDAALLQGEAIVWPADWA